MLVVVDVTGLLEPLQWRRGGSRRAAQSSPPLLAHPRPGCMKLRPDRSGVERPRAPRTTRRSARSMSSRARGRTSRSRIRSSWFAASAHHAGACGTSRPWPTTLPASASAPRTGRRAISSNVSWSVRHAASSSASSRCPLSVHPPRLPLVGRIRHELEHAVADRHLVARAGAPSRPGRRSTPSLTNRVWSVGQRHAHPRGRSPAPTARRSAPCDAPAGALSRHGETWTPRTKHHERRRARVRPPRPLRTARQPVPAAPRALRSVTAETTSAPGPSSRGLRPRVLHQVRLRAHDDATGARQLRVVGSQLRTERRQIRDGIVGREVHDHHQRPAAHDVPEEPVAEARPSLRPLHQAGDVGHDEPVAVAARHAQVRASAS